MQRRHSKQYVNESKASCRRWLLPSDARLFEALPPRSTLARLLLPPSPSCAFPVLFLLVRKVDLGNGAAAQTRRAIQTPASPQAFYY
jgi:hypothetical protein